MLEQQLVLVLNVCKNVHTLKLDNPASTLNMRSTLTTLSNLEICCLKPCLKWKP